jgi:hypothetical protein
LICPWLLFDGFPQYIVAVLFLTLLPFYFYASVASLASFNSINNLALFFLLVFYISSGWFSKWISTETPCRSWKLSHMLPSALDCINGRCFSHRGINTFQTASLEEGLPIISSGRMVLVIPLFHCSLPLSKVYIKGLTWAGHFHLSY